jgi:hypothetical protein
MSAAVLTPEAADRLAKLCGMFGSNHDGERAAAALKADQLVRQNGLTWHDVIVMPRHEAPRDHGWRHGILLSRASTETQCEGMRVHPLDAPLGGRTHREAAEMVG